MSQQPLSLNGFESSDNTDVLPEGYRMTELGPLPKEWRVVRLGDVAEVSSGGSAPQGEQFFKEGKFPFVRVQHLDVDGDYVLRWDLITEDAVKKYRLRKFPAGTIVFPKSGASIRLEKRAILTVDSYIVSHLCAVQPNANRIDNLFLFYCLRNKRLAENKAEGYPVLNLSEIKEVLIPLPPLPEQRAIAYVLRAVQQAKEATEQVIQATRELKKSLMRHLFTYGPVPADAADRVELQETEIGSIPSHWQVVRLGDVFTLRNRIVHPSDTPKARYVGLEHLDSGEIRIRRYGYAFETKSAKTVFEAGDILYGKLRPYLDKSALAEWSGVCSTDILVLIPRQVDLVFAAYLMHSPFVVQQAIATMTGVNHPRTSWKSLSQALIPLPPLSEQQEIARILQAVDEKIRVEEARKEALEALFKSLLHNLMTAKIRLPADFIAQFSEQANHEGE